MSFAKVNKDLQLERDKCSFSVVELTHFLDGGKEKTAERHRIEALVRNEVSKINEVPEEYLSHKEKYERAIENIILVFNLIHKIHEELGGSNESYRDMILKLLSRSVVKDGSPIGVHFLVFMPAILGQGTEEQQIKWFPRAFSGNIIGTFAQTELGHGTFIRGLETTATYDPNTNEFILNTPTLTSHKWWPGGLGNTANYCIVVAQLYVNGKRLGIHSFMVQIRDEETHMPLPGIKVGNIGAKLGLNSVDNGFLGLNNVRIPRTNMLMKHAQVLEDGTYVEAPNTKLVYGTMVFVRVIIVYDMCNYLAKAATIAVRYSAVRRQSQIKEKEPEVQILDFITQQHQLFICIATYHAFILSANELLKIHGDVTKHLRDGGLSRLPELHALACCLKAVCTADTTTCVERCRLSCGGHGYMLSSNLPLMYGLVTAACTYEGENTVLLLQTARYLIKTWQEAENKETLTPTVSYITTFIESHNTLPSWENSSEGIVRAFEWVAASHVSTCVQNLRKRTRSGMSYEDAWNLTSIQLVAAAEAHCRATILRMYYNETMRLSANLSSELALVLENLLQLYVTYWALQKIGDLFRYTSISEQDMNFLQNWYEGLLLKIRPNAVGLVDAFDLTDDILNSALGAYDGRVYERLMAEALKSPLNEEPVNRSFYTHLKPFMQNKL